MSDQSPDLSQAQSYATRSNAARMRQDLIFRSICITAAAIAVIVLIILLFSIFSKGYHRLTWQFLTSMTASDPQETGVLAAVVGTVCVCLVCGVTAIPLGVGTAILLEEYKPKHPMFRRFHGFVQTNITNLAGVPSIVYGILGVTAFATMFGVFGTANNSPYTVGQKVWLRYTDQANKAYYVPVANAAVELAPASKGMTLYLETEGPKAKEKAEIRVISPYADQVRREIAADNPSTTKVLNDAVFSVWKSEAGAVTEEEAGEIADRAVAGGEFFADPDAIRRSIVEQLTLLSGFSFTDAAAEVVAIAQERTEGDAAANRLAALIDQAWTGAEVEIDEQRAEAIAADALRGAQFKPLEPAEQEAEAPAEGEEEAEPKSPEQEAIEAVAGALVAMSEAFHEKRLEAVDAALEFEFRARAKGAIPDGRFPEAVTAEDGSHWHKYVGLGGLEYFLAVDSADAQLRPVGQGMALMKGMSGEAATTPAEFTVVDPDVKELKRQVTNDLLAFDTTLKDLIQETRSGPRNRGPVAIDPAKAEEIAGKALEGLPLKIDKAEGKRALIGELLKMDGLKGMQIPARIRSARAVIEQEELDARFSGLIAEGTLPTLYDEKQPWFFRFPLGRSILAGGLTLMLVILPIIIVSAQEAVRAVPDSMRQGALALGATKWQMIWQMSLRASIPGICTGSILAMSRAIGEAAPLLILAGGIVFVNFLPSHVMDSFTVMPLQIFFWTNQPKDEWREVAGSAIIILLGVLLLFNATAVLIRQKFQRPLA